MRTQQADGVKVRITGRLDALWSDQLDREMAAVVRTGGRRIDLDMEGIDYVSSAGIRILIKHWKELKAIDGALRIVSPSANVRNVLRMSGMLTLLEKPGEAPAKQGPGEPRAAAFPEGGGRFSLFHPAPEARLRLRLVGSPEPLARNGFTASDVTELALPRDTMAVGLGAFGTDFAETRSRFGEFLALGGAAISLPTDASGMPDDQVALEAFVPTIQALYALLCQGTFAHFFHFEPADPGDAPLPLSRLVEMALSLCEAPLIGMALIAESDGLVGAQLRRPPVEIGEGAPFAFPGVRDWLSLTAEKAYPRSLALVAGIAVRDAVDPALASYIRPLAEKKGLAGHFHAAAFSFRALPGGLLDLQKTVADLLETQRVLGVLHLLNDTRDIAGVGESHFIRGAAWAGPLDLASPSPLSIPGGAT